VWLGEGDFVFPSIVKRPVLFKPGIAGRLAKSGAAVYPNVLREGGTTALLAPQTEIVLARVRLHLAQSGIPAFIVGGLVRDIMLERPTGDIDLAIGASALAVVPPLAEKLGGRAVVLDAEHGVVRVVLSADDPGARLTLDFASFGGDITADLGRRDFTVDAMAMPLESAASGAPLIDPYHGREDIERRLVRAVSPGVFQADPIRLLRAVRLAAELDFTIEKATQDGISHDAAIITNVAGERIREELLRLLRAPAFGSALAYLDRLGLLAALFPELGAARGVTQPPEHYWDVYDHSLRTAEAGDFLLRRAVWSYLPRAAAADVPWSAELERHFAAEVSYGSCHGSLLKLAALLHDIAKPEVKAIDDTGRMRFLGHDKVGAGKIAPILERFRFTNREIRLVGLMVRYHMRAGQLAGGEAPTARALYRYFRDAGEAAVDTLFLSLADHLAARGPTIQYADWQTHARMVDYTLTQFLVRDTRVTPPKLLDGHDLIELFGLVPGPRIKQVLEQVREAQAQDQLHDREEALAYVADLLRRRSTGQTEESERR
jgi:poly(A) polymerase